TKTGSTQPKLSAACFAVQSYLAAADFVVFSNYCLIGTRQKRSSFFILPKAAAPLLEKVCTALHARAKGAHTPLREKCKSPRAGRGGLRFLFFLSWGHGILRSCREMEKRRRLLPTRGTRHP
ncbi:MAG: hypothetical protein Q3X13_10065, partial [Oscillospiraceae bacterium]|nr:hypothetical protein [Oscillospiraceae bacterium]